MDLELRQEENSRYPRTIDVKVILLCKKTCQVNKALKIIPRDVVYHN